MSPAHLMASPHTSGSCVNFSWASTNRMNVTAPGKHKQQTTVCRNATARMQHGNNAAAAVEGVMKKFKRRSAATSCVRQSERQKRAEEYLDAMHIHAVMCCCCRRLITPPDPQPARKPQGPTAFINDYS
ncbi:hypothetical protein PAMP_006791 [Pampus punctatissimus]